MRTEGSEAYRLDNVERAPQREERAGASSLRELRGGGLDAQARRPVGAQFVGRLRKVVALVMFVVLVGGARVALSAATVSALEATQSLQTKVSDAETLNGDLKIERSVDASSQRIVRIATENYGMVHSSSVDEVALVTIPTASELAESKAKLAATDHAAHVTAAGAAAMDKFVSRQSVSSDSTTSTTEVTPSNAGANAVTADALS